MKMFTVYDMLNACEACNIDTTRIRTAIYIAERTNPETMEFGLSYDEIARAVGISYSAVAKIMKQLQQSGLIESVSRGVWKWTMPMFEPVNHLDQAPETIEFRFKNYCVE